MVNRRRVLRLAATTAAAGVVVNSQGLRVRSARERIVGLYRLARVLRRTADGQETVTNANPTGRISYDASGRVWVLLAPAGEDALLAAIGRTFQESMRPGSSFLSHARDKGVYIETGSHLL